MNPTKIEWCSHTSNPIRAYDPSTKKHGWMCTKVSAGCKNCYAETLNKFRGTGLDFSAQNESHVELRLDVLELKSVRSRRKPAVIFHCDMTDLFHPKMPPSYIRHVITNCLFATQHTHLLLTKRPERAAELFLDERFSDEIADTTSGAWPPPNILIGTSVSTQRELRERGRYIIDLAVSGFAAFYSVEPLIEPVDFLEKPPCSYLHNYLHDLETDTHFCHWLITGAESGYNARWMNLDWARHLRDQCQASHIPFFMKQICEIKGRTGVKIPFEDFPPDLQIRETPWNRHPRKSGDLSSLQPERTAP